MGTPSENFEKNFNNLELRKKFEAITQLKVKDNPAAFISYINYLSSDTIFRALEEIALKLTK